MDADSPATPIRQRIDYVDGLRALAVIGVIACHTAAEGANGWLSRVLMEGAHGVDLFFVISGFCLAFPTLAKLRSSASGAFDIGDFATKRLVRIIPPFYIATAVLLALAALPHLLTRRVLPDGLPDVHSLSASLLFLDGNVQLLNPSFWTLMVEFRWYFLFPLALWLWCASPRAFFTAGVASLVLYHFTRARGLDFGTLPGFMLGIVAADVQLAGERTATWGPFLRRWAWALLAVGIAAGVAVETTATIPGFYRAEVLWPYQPTIVGWQIACFAFVVLAGTNPALRRVLSIRPLVALGIASYGVYLIHEPVIGLIESRLHGAAAPVVAACVSLGAGFAFWWLAEIPFTTGSLRAPLIAAIRPVVARALAFCGIPAALTLPAPLRTVPLLARVRTVPLRAWTWPRIAVVPAFSVVFVLGFSVFPTQVERVGSAAAPLRFAHVVIATTASDRRRHVFLDRDGRGVVIGAVGDAQLADVNGDGQPDLVAGGVHGVSVLYNPRGRGCADVERCVWAKRLIEPARPSSNVAVGDLDGDGSVDVATEAGIYFNRDRGRRWVFVGRQVIDRDGEGTSIGDLAGDGILDIVAPARSGTVIARFINPLHAGGDPERDVWREQIIDAHPPFHGAMTSAIADLDGDGHRDIILAPTHGAGGLVWYEAPAHPWGHWTRHAIDSTVNNVRQGSLHVADFRGDGHRDIAFAEQAPRGGRVGVLYGVDGDPGKWHMQVLAVDVHRSIAVGVLGHDRVPSIIASSDAHGEANDVIAWKSTDAATNGTPATTY